MGEYRVMVKMANGGAYCYSREWCLSDADATVAYLKRQGIEAWITSKQF